MGLSSKQVSSDGVDWNQTVLLQTQTLELPKPVPMTNKRQHQQMMNNQEQQPERLKCPRCDSTNTKFCYYNNYNKLQPRHFCKACKRHWTKGGTLRNVPIGGGRKNKRIKTSNNQINRKTTTASTRNNNKLSTHIGIDKVLDQQRQINFPNLGLNDQKSLSDLIYQRVMINPESSLLQQSCTISNCRNMMNPPVVPDQNHQVSLRFPFSSSSSSSNFETNPSSISPSFQSSSVYNFKGETTDDSMMMPITSSTTVTQPWQVAAANTSSGIDHLAANYWNWDDIDTFVSTHDLNIHWDDSDIKP